MITKQLIDKIEGEASISFTLKDKKVEFATVAFPHFRGIESILKLKPALDALVITPRVCGICGHAHLMASVRAIEDAYKNAGHEIFLSDKAEKIREFTLIMEIVQNHLKWIYLVLIPELNKLTNATLDKRPLKGIYAASLATKAIATLAGQWPHSSYMVPGGVTCDPTQIEMMQVKSYVETLVSFCETEFLGVEMDTCLKFSSCKDFHTLDSTLSHIEKQLFSLDMHKKGYAHDNFIVLGKHFFTQASRLKQTRIYTINTQLVSTVNSYSPNEKSYALNALYNNIYHEVGPLSREMARKKPLIKNLHRRYKDSAYTRVIARIFETFQLLQHSMTLLDSINILEDSCKKTSDITDISSHGIGIVEAPRGPLIHKIEIDKGLIKSYKIITPTQWNIGSSTQDKLTPAQKAMKGVSQEDAKFIFRTFDVCSVCTTH